MRTVMVLMVVLVTTSCASPMALRGARVLEPGEIEVLASVQGQAGLVERDGALSGHVHPEVSARFGVVDRLDLQLRVDPTVLPEVSVGYQLVGDPQRDDDVALTLTGGLKLGLDFGVAYTFVAVPLQLLVDVPVAEGMAFTGGVRLLPIAFAPGSTPSGLFTPADSADPFGVAASLVAGLRVKIGALVLQPEAAIAGGLGGYGAGALGVSRSLAVASLGLNVGGQFDLGAAPAARPHVEGPASLH